jgi:zinc D-Ala-D-Ala carboxypeptidase
MELGTKISQYFTIKELVRSSTARRNGFDEQFEPSATIIANLEYLAKNVLDPIRVEFGVFSPTSGYRCPALNHAVNGKASSFHLIGCAADIDFGGVPQNKLLFNWIKNNLPFTELINEYNYDWVHVAVVKGRENEKTIKEIV